MASWVSMRVTHIYDNVLSNNIFFTLFARNHALFIPISFYLFKKEAIKKITLYLVIIYGLVTSAIYFTRAPILEFIIICVISYIYTFDINVTKKFLSNLGIIIILFISVFVLSQSLLKGSFDNSINDTKIYFLSGINDLQLIIKGDYPLSVFNDSRFYSFDFLNYILEKLQIIDTYPSLVREYSPFIESNVYTYLDSFILDFGIAGSLIGSAVIGTIGKKAYFSLVREKTLFRIIVYSILCYYSVMIFMNNEFIRFSFLLLLIKALIVEYYISRTTLKTILG